MNVKWSGEYLSRELSAANLSQRPSRKMINDTSIEIQITKCKQLRAMHRNNSKGSLYLMININTDKKKKAIIVGTNKYSQLRI